MISSARSLVIPLHKMYREDKYYSNRGLVNVQININNSCCSDHFHLFSSGLLLYLQTLNIDIQSSRDTRGWLLHKTQSNSMQSVCGDRLWESMNPNWSTSTLHPASWDSFDSCVYWRASVPSKFYSRNKSWMGKFVCLFDGTVWGEKFWPYHHHNEWPHNVSTICSWKQADG